MNGHCNFKQGQGQITTQTWLCSIFWLFISSSFGSCQSFFTILLFNIIVTLNKSWAWPRKYPNAMFSCHSLVSKTSLCYSTPL